MENANIRNIALVGSTGSGKSTTANMLVNGDSRSPFTVGDDAISCTFSTDYHTNQIKGLRLIDTPGFGDNKFSEKEVDKVIQDLTLVITNPSIDSTGVINAFLLPTKFDPRPSTLKKDLEHVMDLFGSVALKTLIILPIFLDNQQRTETDVLNIFRGMDAIVEILKEAKNQELNSNWFCLWDNFKPVPNQEQSLMSKIATLQPYTHKKFLDAQDQIKQSVAIQAHKDAEAQIIKARQDVANERAQAEARIRQAELAAIADKQRVQEAQRKSEEEKVRLLALAKQKEDEHKAEMARQIALIKNRKDCTLETHGRQYLVQETFNCVTCRLVGSAVICKECANTCHKGHSLTLKGSGPSFCDCRFNTLGCQLQNICTYKLTGKSMVRQQRFSCDSCGMNPNKGEMMCQHCAKVCHQSKGHKIRHLGNCLGFCDCSLMYGFCCVNKK